MAAAVLYASLQPQTLTALERRLWKSWKLIIISLTSVQNITGSMPDTLKAVIRDKGDTVPY